VTATFTDSFGRQHTYLRLAVTDRCDLRCHYCMPPQPAWRAPEELLTDDEIVGAVSLFAGLGITKVRLTGGEPTVRPGLIALVARLASVPGIHTLGMTTNGLRLPEMAALLRDAGLSTTALNVSLDSLRPDRYRRITGSDTFPEALAGLAAAQQAGFAPLKLNVVVMRGVNDDELGDFVAFAVERDLNVRFIEYMPFPGNQWEAARFVSAAEMRATISAHYRLEAAPPANGAVAKGYRVVGAAGLVSFITPLSDDFCAACRRLRLTADGAVKTCLFHPAEFSLRELLRRGEPEDKIIAALRLALATKPERHPPAEALVRMHARSMVEIGG